MGKFFRRLEVGWGMLEHKSGNISETRKDKAKDSMARFAFIV